MVRASLRVRPGALLRCRLGARDTGAELIAGLRRIPANARLELVGGPTRTVSGPLTNAGAVELDRAGIVVTGEYAASGQLRLLTSGAVAQAATFRLYATSDFPQYGDSSGRIEGVGTVRGSVSGGTVQAGLREPARAGTLTITGDLTWSDYQPGVIVTGTAAEQISRISVRDVPSAGVRQARPSTSSPHPTVCRETCRPASW